jgi:hypothetical protein
MSEEQLELLTTALYESARGGNGKQEDYLRIADFIAYSLQTEGEDTGGSMEWSELPSVDAGELFQYLVCDFGADS